MYRVLKGATRWYVVDEYHQIIKEFLTEDAAVEYVEVSMPRHVITRQDLAELIRTVKEETGWYYSEMAEWTGISSRSLHHYATKTKFPKDPMYVYHKVRNALLKYRKERGKWYGYGNRKAHSR